MSTDSIRESSPVQQPLVITPAYSQTANLLQQLKQMHSGHFFKPEAQLVHKLKEMPAVELTALLNSHFTEMVEENQIGDPIKFLEPLAEAIPLTSLEAAVHTDAPRLLEEAQGMFEEAKLYLKMDQHSPLLVIKEHVLRVLDIIVSALESVINAFGVRDFFKPAENEAHSRSNSEKISMLLRLFTMVTALVLPLIGAATAGWVIGGALLGIAALSLLWPFIKPQPSHLPANAENWTKQVQQSAASLEGRRDCMDQIANILKMNRHVMLVGPSRVGKTLTAKAFVQAIERGDYPELKGKLVFRINAADLIGQKASMMGGGDNILYKISDAMGRHRNDIILVLDEIHMTCKNNEKMADQLKPFLDEGGDFPHVIGITTDEEFEKYVRDNHAFSLRFDRVDVENMGREETLQVLSHAVLSSQAKPLIKNGVLQYIYEKSNQIEEARQPAASLKLLRKCIAQTEKTQQSPTEKKIAVLIAQIGSLRALAAANRSREKKDGLQEVGIEAKASIPQLEKQLQDLYKQLNGEKKKVEALLKSKHLLDKVSKEIYSAAVKLSRMAQQSLNHKQEKQLKKYILLREFLSKAVESYVVEKSEALGFHSVIDESLVDSNVNFKNSPYAKVEALPQIPPKDRLDF